ncbi:MAG: class I SAM-dependent methyltransferase [Planctomycetota bacterium]
MSAKPPTWPDYQLLDFGGGRKLERFGGATFDRPCPAAADVKPRLTDWQADATYTGAKVGDGRWKSSPRTASASSESGAIDVPVAGRLSFRVQIELSPAGQVGLFPEQFANWRWIANRLARAGRPLRVLNLFAYTGGSTLAAAAGAELPRPSLDLSAYTGEYVLRDAEGSANHVEVTHVDASKPSVALARRNAELSGLSKAPIRWIVEDAVKYCRREVKRGARYDAVILDPPSYGHGPKGEEWKLARDLPALLELCGELTERAPTFFLATCHTPGVGPAELSAYLSDAIVGHCGQPPAAGRLMLTTPDERQLESGVYARWPR